MLAKLLPTLCLVALVACFDDDPFPILRAKGIYPSDHITLSARVLPDVKLFSGPHYYIEDAECKGYIDTVELCGKEDIRGVEVRVSDPFSFAHVNINKEKGLVSIHRRGIDNDAYCPGEALVDLRLSCDHWKFTRSHNRLRLPSLLGSDSSDSTASDSLDSDEDDHDATNN